MSERFARQDGWPADRSAEAPADGACRVYMVRHGQTVWNVDKRFRGTIEVPLNSKGRLDAIRAADSLAHVGLTAVYTSPLSRAREVAAAIAAASGLHGFTDHPGLLNLDYGEWHGLTKSECRDRDPEAWRLYLEDPDAAACPGGEKLSDAADRAAAALISLGELHPGESVAAVSHGAMVRLAALRAGYVSGQDWEIPLDTGSATAFDVRDGRLSVAAPPTPTELAPRGAAPLVHGPTPIAASQNL
jgi:broad specificity phosphatase PhoE